MRRPVRPLSLLAPLLAVVAGCSPRNATRTDTSLAMGESVPPTADGGTTQGVAQGARNASDSARAEAPAPGVADNAPSLWLVSARGIGPVAAGMRFATAAPLLGVPASAGSGS